jgi:hypothetical protein
MSEEEQLPEAPAPKKRFGRLKDALNSGYQRARVPMHPELRSKVESGLEEALEEKFIKEREDAKKAIKRSK